MWTGENALEARSVTLACGRKMRTGALCTDGGANTGVHTARTEGELPEGERPPVGDSSDGDSSGVDGRRIIPPAPAIKLPEIRLERCCLRARWLGSVRVAEPLLLPPDDPGVRTAVGSGVLNDRTGGCEEDWEVVSTAAIAPSFAPSTSSMDCKGDIGVGVGVSCAPRGDGDGASFVPSSVLLPLVLPFPLLKLSTLLCGDTAGSLPRLGTGLGGAIRAVVPERELESTERSCDCDCAGACGSAGAGACSSASTVADAAATSVKADGGNFAGDNEDLNSGRLGFGTGTATAPATAPAPAADAGAISGAPTPTELVELCVERVLPLLSRDDALATAAAADFELFLTFFLFCDSSSMRAMCDFIKVIFTMRETLGLLIRDSVDIK